MTNSKSADLSPPSLELDGPPSYDNAIGSSSTFYPQASSSAPPPHTLSPQQVYLFSGPSHPEDLAAPIRHDIEHIDVRHRSRPVVLSRDLTLSRIVGSDTNDPQLSDPQVLYDFLRMSATHVPKIRLRCTGSHTETAAVNETVNTDHGLQVRKKGEPYTMVDFAFFVDMTDIVTPAGTGLTALSSFTPAYRGKSSAAYGASYAPARGSRRGYTELAGQDGKGSTASGLPLSWAEHDQLRIWNERRWGTGFPVWAKPSEVPGNWLGGVDVDGERGVPEEASLLEWCEAYCADRGWLKQFILRRDVWGWNFDGLVKAVTAAITSTGYNQTLMVRVEWDEPEVVIKPSNRWTRANSNVSLRLSITYAQMLIHVALCITLIYPIIWLLNYSGLLPRSGGKFDIARATYNLKPYAPLPSTYPGESLQDAQDRLPSLIKLHPQLPSDPVLRLGPQGVHYLAGRKEGEWFAEWEERIKAAVQMRFKGELTGRAEPMARDVSLDGYERNWVEA